MIEDVKPNKRILITGSSRGIGASIARNAKQKGYEVILHGKDDSALLNELKDELKSEAVTFDVSDWKAAETKIKQLGKLDILVNCAGINYSAPLEELTLDDWKSTYAVNVFGLVGVTKASLPLLKNSRFARIVNIGSVKGSNTTVGRAAYASSKAAVANITAAMAKEFGPGILVNCVAPGFVNTDMTKQTMSLRIEAQISSALLSRVASVNEISSAVMFFCSEESSFITGQTLLVDGGFSIKSE